MPHFMSENELNEVTKQPRKKVIVIAPAFLVPARVANSLEFKGDPYDCHL